ncbi:hypothetical protein [Pseudomonas sp. SO81]|uniref:hypothetical protein n=1 Tax=Pseudomonas sp. SO81 TaxID=2983246 RepID=UPI0025A46804|nr:hypothetical protein [Pseudomonas sp. SO81]WJN60909.1 hypothetical protein OH686_19365 [Pseudomonas sp. SO81]
MARLTDYLCELVELLGHPDSVHFDSVTEGSACLNTHIDDSYYQHVVHRVREAGQNVGPKRAIKAYKRLASLMEEDRVDGILRTDDAQILQFPKVKSSAAPLVVIKQGSVQGRLYIVGGKDDTVPVRLEGANGETLLCEADTHLAEELGKLLFKHVRVHGKGEWQSRPHGGWRLKKMFIHSYEKLEKSNLKGTVDRIKRAGGMLWDDQEDPHATIHELRS